MASPQPAARKEPKSTGEVVGDLWTLLKDYAQQETVDPLKSLWRFVAYGSGAALCFAIAGILLTVAVVRILQVEGRRWLHGNWSWLVYVVALVITSVAAFISVRQIKKGRA